MAPNANSPANIRLDKDVFQGRLQKTSSSHIDQDEYIRFSQGQGQYIRLGQDVFKTFLRRLQDILQKRLQDIFKTSCKHVFKTSSRRPAKMPSRYFQNVSSSETVLVLDVSETYCKDGLSTEAFAKVTLLRNLWSVHKICKGDKHSQVLVFHCTTPFSDCLQRRT